MTLAAWLPLNDKTSPIENLRNVSASDSLASDEFTLNGDNLAHSAPNAFRNIMEVAPWLLEPFAGAARVP